MVPSTSRLRKFLATSADGPTNVWSAQVWKESTILHIHSLYQTIYRHRTVQWVRQERVPARSVSVVTSRILRARGVDAEACTCRRACARRAVTRQRARGATTGDTRQFVVRRLERDECATCATCRAASKTDSARERRLFRKRLQAQTKLMSASQVWMVKMIHRLAKIGHSVT